MPILDAAVAEQAVDGDDVDDEHGADGAHDPVLFTPRIFLAEIRDRYCFVLIVREVKLLGAGAVIPVEGQS